MNRRPRIADTRNTKVLYVLPEIDDDLDPVEKNALAIRNQCTLEGRCPVCGTVGVIHEDPDHRGIFHYTFMHENLFDMNHQFMHRKQMGSITAKCLGRDHGEDWAQVEYSFTRAGGGKSHGERVIVELTRSRAQKRGDF